MRPGLRDAAIALAVAVPTSLDAWWSPPGARPTDALSYALMLVPAAALLARRRAPVGTALVCAAALAVWYLTGNRGAVAALPLMVALYTIAVRGDRRRTLIAGACVAALLCVLAIIVGYAGLPATELALPAAALLLGEAVRSRRELVAEQAARAERDRIERDAEADRRAQRERLHLARELHDVIAHTVAAMNVHAGVAAEAFDQRPAVAREAIAQVRALGRGAAAELRATVTVLREGPGTTAPAPGLADIATLVEGARTAGLAVSLHTDVPGDTPPMVGLAAYRIVQESLTNVIRHAGARSAEVRVRRRAAGIEVEIIDDGVRTPPGDLGSGHRGFGLRGIRERTAGLGGTADYGPRDGGGFRVHAVLPVTP